jgi:hypothetical protein
MEGSNQPAPDLEGFPLQNLDLIIERSEQANKSD